MLSFIRRYSPYLQAIAFVALFGIGILFGTGFLDNVHQFYLKHSMKNVVKIQNSKGSGGTGWITSSTKSGKTVIITNAHVCGLAENGYVYVSYNYDRYLLKVITKFDKHDLCAIEAPSTAAKGYRIAANNDYAESVYTLGHPLLEPRSLSKGEYSGTVQVTIMQGMNVDENDCKGEGYQLVPGEQLGDLALLFGIKNICIRTLWANASTIVILPGNSGSPDVNIFGHVVGVAFAANEAGTRSYHVPLEYLKEFLGQL